jgi:hypothetical protein
MSKLTLREFVEMLSWRYPQVRSTDSIDLGRHLVLPHKVYAKAAVSQPASDEPHIDFSLGAVGSFLLRDRNFLRTLYEKGSSQGNETKVEGSFTLDEFREVEIPVQSIDRLLASKFCDVEKEGRTFPYETIGLEYKTCGEKGHVISVSATRFFNVEMRKISKELGLNMVNVNFKKRDYIEMRKVFPEKFSREFDDESRVVGVPMSDEELKIAEKHLGKKLLPVFIQEYYRSIDAEADPELAFSLMKKGFELIDQAQIHVGDMQEEGDFDIRVDGGKAIITYRQIPSPILYWVENLPASLFPDTGEVLKISAHTNTESRTTNMFSLENITLSPELCYQHILMRVSLRDPVLAEAQQEILDRIGVGFKYLGVKDRKVSTAEDIFGPDEEIPPLQELIAQNFRQLESLFLATRSRRYQYGRRSLTAREAREIYTAERTSEYDPKFDFSQVLINILENHKPLRGCDRSMVWGSFDADLLIDLHAACKYLVENGRDFHKTIRPGHYTEIKCRLPYKKSMQRVCTISEKLGIYVAACFGTLPNGKNFYWHAGHSPKFIGDAGHPNDFFFNLRHPDELKEKEVHLNGPRYNPVIKDLLTLAKSVMNYAESQVEEGGK